MKKPCGLRAQGLRQKAVSYSNTHEDMAPAATIIRFSNIPGYTNAAGVFNF